MTVEDVCFILTHRNMLSTPETSPPPICPSPGQSIKYPKGRKNSVARRHLQRTATNDNVAAEPAPFTPPTEYEIRWEREEVTTYLATWEAKGYLKLRPEKLKWSPFLLTRSKNLDGVPALTGTADSIPLAQTMIPAPPSQQNAQARPSKPHISSTIDTDPFLDTTPGPTPTKRRRGTAANSTREASEESFAAVEDALSNKLSAEDRGSSRNRRMLKSASPAMDSLRPMPPKKRRRVVSSSPELDDEGSRSTRQHSHSNGDTPIDAPLALRRTPRSTSTPSVAPETRRSSRVRASSPKSSLRFSVTSELSDMKIEEEPRRGSIPSDRTLFVTDNHTGAVNGKNTTPDETVNQNGLLPATAQSITDIVMGDEDAEGDLDADGEIDPDEGEDIPIF